MNNDLRIETVNAPTGIEVRSAYFVVGNKSLGDITREFRCKRSNERMATLLTGFHAERRPIIDNFIGTRFIVDTMGGNLSSGITRFSPKVRTLLNEFSYMDDGFYSDADKATSAAQEALKYKELFKAVLGYSKTICINSTAQNLIVFEVTGEESPSVIEAIFSGMTENTLISFAEIAL